MGIMALGIMGLDIMALGIMAFGIVKSQCMIYVFNWYGWAYIERNGGKDNLKHNIIIKINP